MSDLPTLAKTWQFNKINQGFTASGTAVTDLQTILLAMVNSLLGQTTNLVTCAGSSNASTSNMTGTNLWSTIGNITNAPGGSAHSWIVLKFAGASNLYLLIDCNVGNYAYFTLSVSFAGFTGGSTTAAPTATDQKNITGGSYINFGQAGSVNYRLHVWSSTDGAEYRLTLWYANTVQFTLLIMTGNTVPTGLTWANPVVIGVLGNNGLSFGNLSTAAWAWGLIGSVWCNFQLTTECYGNNAICTTQNFPDDNSGEYQFFFCGLYTLTATCRGRKAYTFDLWFGLSSNNNGDNYPASGTLYQFVQFGILIFPWDGATPPAIA